jgi:hypothetical protein
MVRNRLDLLIASIVILVLGVVVCVTGEFRPRGKGILPGTPPIGGAVAIFVGVCFVAIGLWGLYRFGKSAPGDESADENRDDYDPFPGDEPE